MGQSLRKTGQNYLRGRHSAEVAAAYAAHGRPFPADDLLEGYSNKPIARMHAAVDDLGAWLRPVWDSAAAPFPPEWVDARAKGGPNIAPALIEEIKRLAAEGLGTGEIGERVGVSRETARRWAKRATASAD